MSEATMQERWKSFVHHWALHHDVQMSPAARLALERAVPPPEVFGPLAAPAGMVFVSPPCQHFSAPEPPAAPQAALF